MKDFFILLIIILCGCGWVANKYVQKANTSSEQKTRFIELAEGYNDNAKLFLIEQAKEHHEEAFEASYRMWVLSPIAELDLSSHYDEKTYYLTLGKKIKQSALQSQQQDAYKMLLDMAKHYGVKLKTQKPAVKNLTRRNRTQTAGTQRVSVKKRQTRRQKNHPEQSKAIR